MEHIKDSRRKILFFAEAVTLAHVARAMVLAGSLDATDYDVVVAVDPRYSHLFEGNGLRTVDIESISTKQFCNSLDRGKPIYDEATLIRYVEQDKAVFEREKPDIVVGDFRISLSVSARLAQVPYATVTNIYWSPYARQRYPIPQHPLVPLLGVAVAQRLFDLVRPLAFALHSRPLNRVRAKYGLSSLGASLQRVYTDADYVLYADIEGMFGSDHLPDSHCFIGPVLWSPPSSNPPWWNEIRQSKPILYLSLGSSGRSDLLREVIEGLADLDCIVLASTAGERIAVHDKENVYVAKYLPGEQATALSRVVICNGGSLTTYQALKCGVPVLGLAGNLDQHLNMAAVEKAGAGLKIRTENVTAARVCEVVRRLLNEESFQSNAKMIRAKIATYSPGTLFGKALDRMDCKV
jgi:UDP:flavonoid glycosyltransferase YjiC (YdhE family)